MVKLRLSRTGRKGEATYRVIAVDSNRKRDTKALEYVGFYLPHQKTVELNKERIQYWLSVGAQPTETVHRMFVKAGLMKKETLPKHKFAVKPGQKTTDRREAKAAKATKPVETKVAEPEVVEPQVAESDKAE